MALKGTDIVKKLPDGGKKNCKECGFPTCFAYAMKLASAGTTVDKCTYLSAEVKAELTEALAPPQKLVTVGTGATAVKFGNEEVLYRHEKAFFNKPALAILINDNEAPAAVDAKVKKIKDMKFDRVGLTLKADMLALRNASGNRASFEALVKKVAAATDVPLALISEDFDALVAARQACGARNPLVYPITKDNADKAIAAFKSMPTVLGLRGANVEELIPLTTKFKAAGLDDLMLDPGSKNVIDAIRDQTFIRRATLKLGFRALGYPTLAFPALTAGGGLKEMAAVAALMCKYPSIIVVSDFDEHSLLPITVQRLNIYTDPRVPMSVEEKIYGINGADENSPVLLTGNWALTYFIVSSETEGSKVPAWLAVKHTEGLGVLTAWAAGKFSGDNIGPFIKKIALADKVKHRKLVIPGKVARIKGEVEEALPGWEIIVGPREASEIPAWLPKLMEKWKN
jgi:acetyl-CoA decarbonylase/synthase complex subunit gamma